MAVRLAVVACGEQEASEPCGHDEREANSDVGGKTEGAGEAEAGDDAAEDPFVLAAFGADIQKSRKVNRQQTRAAA